MRACYLEVGMAIRPLLLQNALLEEIVDAIRQRKRRLEEALEPVNFVLFS